MHTYKATPPPALPARSCRRRLYPGSCRWETDSKGVRKVSVIATASKLLVDMCASNSEKWEKVDSLFTFMWPKVKNSIIWGDADE